MAGRPPGRAAARAPGLRRGRLYFHVVFTLPRPIADIAYQNQAVVYDLLLKTAAETLITIAPTGQARGLKAHDPKHLGARIGLTAVLHTWGSALTHHPHAHIIVPGGGFRPTASAGSPAPSFFLSVRVLSRLFRRLVLESLTAAYQAGRLESRRPGGLANPAAFQTFLAALRKVEWRADTKRLWRTALSSPTCPATPSDRYRQQPARRLRRRALTFKWKDYRDKRDARYKLMTLDADEFIRRFLIHVLPDGFHRIRHYGLFANANRAGNTHWPADCSAYPTLYP